MGGGHAETQDGEFRQCSAHCLTETAMPTRSESAVLLIRFEESILAVDLAKYPVCQTQVRTVNHRVAQAYNA